MSISRLNDVIHSEKNNSASINSRKLKPERLTNIRINSIDFINAESSTSIEKQKKNSRCVYTTNVYPISKGDIGIENEMRWGTKRKPRGFNSKGTNKKAIAKLGVSTEDFSTICQEEELRKIHREVVRGKPKPSRAKTRDLMIGHHQAGILGSFLGLSLQELKQAEQQQAIRLKHRSVLLQKGIGCNLPIPDSSRRKRIDLLHCSRKRSVLRENNKIYAALGVQGDREWVAINNEQKRRLQHTLYARKHLLENSDKIAQKIHWLLFESYKTQLNHTLRSLGITPEEFKKFKRLQKETRIRQSIDDCDRVYPFNAGNNVDDSNDLKLSESEKINFEKLRNAYIQLGYHTNEYMSPTRKCETIAKNNVYATIRRPNPINTQRPSRLSREIKIQTANSIKTNLPSDNPFRSSDCDFRETSVNAIQRAATEKKLKRLRTPHDWVKLKTQNFNSTTSNMTSSEISTSVTVLPTKIEALSGNYKWARATAKKIRPKNIISSGIDSPKPVSLLELHQMKKLTLRQLLATEEGLEMFTRHLISEYSEENIHFWMAVEYFRSSAELCNDSLLFSHAQDIIDTYIVPTAEEQINLDSKTKRAIFKCITSHKSEGTRLSINIFNDAQENIFSLMNSGPFFRFKKMLS